MGKEGLGLRKTGESSRQPALPAQLFDPAAAVVCFVHLAPDRGRGEALRQPGRRHGTHLEDLQRLVQLAVFAIGGDERGVGGGGGLRPRRQHTLVDAQRLLRLPAHVARDDDCRKVEGRLEGVDQESRSGPTATRGSRQVAHPTLHSTPRTHQCYRCGFRGQCPAAPERPAPCAGPRRGGRCGKANRGGN